MTTSMSQATIILLVEDNLIDFHLIYEMLTQLGDSRVEILHADTLADGIHQVNTHRVDLVLLDLNLPDSEGLDTFLKMRQTAPYAPVVVLSGVDSSELALQAVQNGAQDYLIKGKLNADLLMRSLRYAIERQRWEKRVRETEIRYQNIFNGIRDAILVEDLDGHVLDANESACRMYGYTREQILQMTAGQLAPPEAFQEFDRLMQEIEATNHTTVEVPNLRASGEVFYAEITIQKDSLGEQPVLLIMIRDVSERRRTEQAYRNLVENSLQELYIFQNRRVVYANPAAVQNSGYTLEELRALSPDEVRANVHPEDRARVAHNAEARLEGQNVPRLDEIRLLTKEGRTRWVASLAVLGEYDGQPAIQTAQFDITERKQVEESLRHRLAVESLISQLSTQFINASHDQMDAQINAALQALGEFAGVDRCYLDLFNEDCTAIENVYEWCAPGIQPMRDTFVGQSLKDLKWSTDTLHRFEPVHVPNLSDLPPEAVGERQLWDTDQLTSILLLPVAFKKALSGYVGFSNVSKPKEWDDADISMLRMLGDMLMNALQRQRADTELRRAQEHNRLLLESIQTPVLAVDEYFHVQYCNEAFTRLFGLTPAELTGRSLFVYAQEIQHSIFFKAIDEAIHTGAVQTTEGWLNQRYYQVWVYPNPTGALSIAEDLTERKQAQEELEQARYDLHQMMASVNDALWSGTVDKDGRLVYRYLSPVIETITGVAYEVLLADSRLIRPRIHPDDRDWVFQRFSELNAGQRKKSTMEFRLLKDDGSITWVRDSQTAQVMADGRLRLDAVVSDITEQVKARQQLQKRLELEALISHITTRFINLTTHSLKDQVQFALEATGRFADVDRCYWVTFTPSGDAIQDVQEWLATNIQPRRERLVGLNLDFYPWMMKELRSEGVLSVDRLENLPPEASAEKALWQAQGVQSILAIALGPSDQMVGFLGLNLERAPRPWDDQTMHMLRLIASIFTNLHIRMQAEESLRRSEAQYRALVQTLPDSISTMDMNGCYNYVSEQTLRLYGYDSPEEMLGTFAVLSVVEVDRERLQQDLLALSEDHPVVTFTGTMQRKDGSLFSGQAHIARLTDSEGKPTGYIVSVRDISDSYRAQMELSGLNEELRRTVLELESRNNDANLLNELGDLLQGCLNVSEVYDVVSSTVPRIFPGMSGGLYMSNASRRYVESALQWNATLHSELVFEPDRCWALRRGRAHLSQPEHNSLSCRHIAEDSRIIALCTPLVAQGETQGLFYLEGSPNMEGLQRTQQLATMVSERVALALANLRLSESLQAQSIRDPLTGLYNRYYVEVTLQRDLHRAIRKKLPIGLVMLHLDLQALPVAKKDHWTQTLAGYLQSNVRTSDIICRYSADEFLIILPDALLTDCVRRAESLHKGFSSLRRHYKDMDFNNIQVGFGLAAYPEHGDRINELIEKVRLAANQAVQEPEDPYHIAPQTAAS